MSADMWELLDGTGLGGAVLTGPTASFSDIAFSTTSTTVTFTAIQGNVLLASFDSPEPTVAPEPASLAILGGALVGFGLRVGAAIRLLPLNYLFGDFRSLDLGRLLLSALLAAASFARGTGAQLPPPAAGSVGYTTLAMNSDFTQQLPENWLGGCPNSANGKPVNLGDNAGHTWFLNPWWSATYQRCSVRQASDPKYGERYSTSRGPYKPRTATLAQ